MADKTRLPRTSRRRPATSGTIRRLPPVARDPSALHLQISFIIYSAPGQAGLKGRPAPRAPRTQITNRVVMDEDVKPRISSFPGSAWERTPRGSASRFSFSVLFRVFRGLCCLRARV
jgi:hypothetical protein